MLIILSGNLSKMIVSESKYALRSSETSLQVCHFDRQQVPSNSSIRPKDCFDEIYICFMIE